MRSCVPRLSAATASTSGAAYTSGNWAALRETVSAASTDNVKDLLAPSLIPTRHFQRSLPRLPLPQLSDTLNRYLTALDPLCSPRQHVAATAVVQAFKEQEGPRLQEELRQTDKANLHTSYISSDIFEQRLKERHPLPLRSHHSWLVRPDSEKADMLVRSAYWLWASVQFYKLYLDNQLKPEVRHARALTCDDAAAGPYWRRDWFNRTAALLPDIFSTPFVYYFSGGNVLPLDMSQFDCLFNCARMPGVLQDEITPVGFVPQVAVQFRGHQFVVTVADDDCVPLSIDQIYAQLRDIVDTRVAPARTDMSVFTALPRSEWNAVRTTLLRNTANSKSVEAVEESMLVLNLDEDAEDVGGSTDPLCAAGATAKAPTLRPTCRWWDKSLAVSVNRRGAVTVSAEASWGDTVAVRRYIDDVFALSHAAHSDLLKRSCPSNYPVRQLQWHIPSELHAIAQRARLMVEADARRLDVAAGVLDVPLTSPMASVQSTVQLAAQLAWWRLQQRPTGCLQTVDMQRYRRGRTEQVCLTTAAFAKFALSMLGSDTGAQTSACQAALRSLASLRSEVEKGHGTQCHLLALRMTAERLLGKTPEVFRDPTHALLQQGGVRVEVMESPAAYGRGFAVNPFGYQLSCSRSGGSLLYQVSNMSSPTCSVPSSRAFADAFGEACREVSALRGAA